MEWSRSDHGLLTRFHAQLAEGETSDRSFGLFSGAAFLAFGLLPLIRNHSSKPLMWIPGAALLVAGVACPGILRMPKRAWLFLGFLLGLAINPIVLGVVFATAITPAGWLMRRFGLDPLRLRTEETLPTYWLARTGPASGMNDQF